MFFVSVLGEVKFFFFSYFKQIIYEKCHCAGGWIPCFYTIWLVSKQRSPCTHFQPHPHCWTFVHIGKVGNRMVQGMDCRHFEAPLPTPQIPQVCFWLNWQFVLECCHAVGVCIFWMPRLSKHHILSAVVEHSQH